MVRDLTLGNPPISVTLRRSARARRLSLRVSRLDGKVSLTVPPRASQREAMAFLKEREDWLRGHLSQVAAPIVPRIDPCGSKNIFRMNTTKFIMLKIDHILCTFFFCVIARSNTQHTYWVFQLSRSNNYGGSMLSLGALSHDQTNQKK